jgi:hypothetical protein
MALNMPIRCVMKVAIPQISADDRWLILCTLWSVERRHIQVKLAHFAKSAKSPYVKVAVSLLTIPKITFEHLYLKEEAKH